MIHQQEMRLPPMARGFHLITDTITEQLSKLPDEGLLHVFMKHTSAALSINENADPSVRDDMEKIYNNLVPENEPYYTHTAEGPDDMPSHVKASITGSSITIPITGGRLNLGTWQGIYLCEFRNHAAGRKLVVTIYS
jgi:secondary thiamine-phosphate synthase enzyme